MLVLLSCTKQQSETKQKTQASTTTTEEVAPPINYGDEGPLYTDSEGNALVRILSMDEQELNIKRLDIDSIYNLRRTESTTLLEYADEANQAKATFDDEQHQQLTLTYQEGANTIVKKLQVKGAQ